MLKLHVASEIHSLYPPQGYDKAVNNLKFSSGLPIPILQINKLEVGND